MLVYPFIPPPCRCPIPRLDRFLNVVCRCDQTDFALLPTITIESSPRSCPLSSSDQFLDAIRYHLQTDSASLPVVIFRSIPPLYTNVLFFSFRDVESMWASFSLNGTVMTDVCPSSVLSVKHAYGSQYLVRSRYPNLLRPQYQMTHASTQRDSEYMHTRNNPLVPSFSVAPPTAMIHPSPRTETPSPSSHSNEIFARRVRNYHAGPSSFNPSEQSMETDNTPHPHPILDATSNYAVTESSERVPDLPTHQGQIAEAGTCQTFQAQYPATNAASSLAPPAHTTRSAVYRDAQDLNDGYSTVIHRPEQARPSILQMPWTSQWSSNHSDAGYSADLEDARAIRSQSATPAGTHNIQTAALAAAATGEAVHGTSSSTVSSNTANLGHAERETAPDIRFPKHDESDIFGSTRHLNNTMTRGRDLHRPDP